MPETTARAETEKVRAQSLHHYALGCLARREHCRAELRRKLRARDGGDEATTENLLDTLQAAGHLSEARFVEALIRSRVRRGCGPVRIRQELRQRGAEEDCIEKGLQTADCNWQELAEHMHARKFGGAAPASFEEKMKHARYLESRGFERETIQKTLAHLSGRDSS